MAVPTDRRPTDRPSPASAARPMAPGRERSGPPERRSLAVRSATITVMIRAAFAAAKNLKRDFGEVEQLQVSEKGPGDFVSHADIKAERTLRAELARTRPEYGFLGEEGGETKGDGRNRWIVDPLDGTTNFLHGVPHFAISIGLERDGEIIAGVIYQPISDELFWAEKGNGAFVDTPNARSRRLRVSGRKDPARALVATGIPHIGKGDHAAYLAKLAAVTERTAGVRRWGAAVARPRLRRRRPLRCVLRVRPGAVGRRRRPAAGARGRRHGQRHRRASPTSWAARRSSPATSACASRWSRCCPRPDGARRAAVEQGSAIGYCRAANPVERQLVMPSSSAAVRSLALAVLGWARRRLSPKDRPSRRRRPPGSPPIGGRAALPAAGTDREPSRRVPAAHRPSPADVGSARRRRR